MRLVNRKQGELAVAVEAVEQSQKAVGEQPFRRDINQVKLAAQQFLLGGARAGVVERRVQVGGAHARLQQGIHLVLHQCDERRDNHADTGAQQRRNLVAQRFAAASGHQDQRVATAGYVLNDLFLRAAK